MQLTNALLTVLLPVASATPVLLVIRPFIPHSLARAVPVPTQSDLPTDTVISGPIPTKWRHTHGPLIQNLPSDISLIQKSDEPIDTLDATRHLDRAIDGNNDVATTTNNKDIIPVAPKLKILLPLPPMTNVQICEALCSMNDTEPCGPCEDVSNSPEATIPPPNAERTDTVSARAFTTQQDKAWLPLWRCLMQCIEERYTQCEMCNDYWTFYQSSLPLGEFEDPEMKQYIEITRCFAACGGGKYGPACTRCDALWSEWERALSPYIGLRGSDMVKREPFRGNIIGLTLYGCLKGCDPERPENSQDICARCRKMVSMFPPVFIHNWATERLTLKPEYYNSVTTGPGGNGV